METKRASLAAFVMLAYAALACFTAAVMAQEATVVTYEAPQGAEKAEDFVVKVNGREIFVYDSQVAAFAYFSFSGKVSVTVTPDEDVDKVDIRPKSHGIAHSVEGRAVSFQLDRPCNLSVEINGDIKRPLFLFANPLEQDPPKPGDENVRYFEGGKIHEAGEIKIESGQTVYIAGGAIVRGRIRAEGAENVRVLGRGILDGSGRDYKTQMVKLSGCSNVELNGIIVFNSYGWTLVPVKSQNLRFANVKVIGWRDNDDGIDIVGCTNLSVENCFLRTKDDCIAVKASPGYFEEGESGLCDVENVRVIDSVLWNAEWGNAMEIGFELQTQSIRQILFANCDIIHVERGGTFTIHNGDFATVENIRFEDIRVEDSRDKLIEFRVGLSIYSGDCPWELHRQNPQRKRNPLGQWVGVEGQKQTEHAAKRGHIRNIHFKDIAVTGSELPKSYLIGYDEAHCVENVLIENLQFNGRRILSAQDGNFTAETARNVQFVASSDMR
ncbi:MAG: glycosyl hydrolase family 28 protein [Planctomycetota bacterium]